MILTLVSGSIWALDKMLWAKQRNASSSALDDDAAQEPIVIEYANSLFPVFLVVLLLRSFIGEPYEIPSGSMKPTLLVGDYILVSKFSYGVRLPVIDTKILDVASPQRGDVFVFRYPEDNETNFIKRTVGVPGDQGRAGLVDERVGGGLHDPVVPPGLADRFVTGAVRQIADQRVDGVVTVELGLLERQQVALLYEHVDPATVPL